MGTRNLNLGDYNIAFVLLAGGQSARYKGNKLLSTHPVSSLPLIEHSVRTLIKAKEIYLTAPSASASRALFTRACNQSTLPVQNQVTVVTGKWHSSIEAQLSQLPVNLVCNTAWKEGMASSIREGVKHVLSISSQVTLKDKTISEGTLKPGCQKEADWPTHVLFSLADLPCLVESDVLRLIEASQKNPNNIVCSQWHISREKPGVANNSGARLTVPAIFPKDMFNELLSLRGDVGAKPVINKYLKAGRVTMVPTPNAQFDIDTSQDWSRISRLFILPSHNLAQSKKPKDA